MILQPRKPTGRAALLVTFLLSLVAPPPAAAESVVVIEAAGEAAGAADDLRTRALDRAFARAVEIALDRLLGEETRQRHRRVLQDEVIRRARRYVASFQVLEERRSEGGVAVRVAASVDRDRLRAAIRALGIEDAAGGRVGRPPLVLLLKQSIGEETQTTFGSAAGEGGAAGRALRAALTAEGFQIVSASGGAPVAIEREGSSSSSALPLGDDAALEIAREAGAGAAFVAGALTWEDGRIRGTHLVGARGRAVVRVLDAASGRRVVAEENLDGAGYGRTGEEAMERAAMELGARAASAVLGALSRHWPAVSAPEEELVIKIRGARSWEPIAAIIRKLAQREGVSAIHPRVIRSGGVLLGLDTSLTAPQILSEVRGTRLSSGRLTAVTREGEVWVRVEGESRYSSGED